MLDLAQSLFCSSTLKLCNQVTVVTKQTTLTTVALSSHHITSGLVVKGNDVNANAVNNVSDPMYPNRTKGASNSFTKLMSYPIVTRSRFELNV